MASNPNPFLDFDVTRMMSDFRVPGFDTEALMAAQRRNIEALTKANQLAAEGMQAVMRRQAEIMRQTMEEASRMMGSIAQAGGPERQAVKQAEVAKTAFEAAIANMKEIADLMARANQDTYAVINKRVAEGMDEVRALMAKAADAKTGPKA
ncbi:phasin family protein [Stella humosa]|uniref:Phasin family protein n=1 Tax=Stella humosa TaxID=94 RepID=A0A3N1KZ71_9PROT|nr:phasin family protein [Stella humosa]ROP84457.1 phasin family protein [Stella humosa]BBK33975.1 phasin [Stella humosa]